jgi:UDP-glucuronate decarboxylase
VDDLIEGFVRLMASPDGVTGPINLGNPNEFTIRQLAEAVLAKVGGQSRLVCKPLPSDDPKQRQPNIEQAKAVLGWQPQVQLEEGLDKTIAYFRRFLQS